MPRPSHIVTSANNKGGVGKTTTTTNAAIGMLHQLRALNIPDPRVLLVDADSQCHATLTTAGRMDNGKNLATVLTADLQHISEAALEAIVPSTWDDQLHVLPSSPSLDEVAHELAGTPGAPYRLADALSNVRQTYDFVFIDTNPSFSLLTENAILAATDVIIPIEPRYLETVGLMSAIRRIHDIKDGWRHPNLRISGILVTKMDTRISGHNQVLADLKQHEILGPLLSGVIPVNEAVSYAHRNHLSVFDYDARCSASHAYARFVNTLIRRLYRKDAS